MAPLHGGERRPCYLVCRPKELAAAIGYTTRCDGVIKLCGGNGYLATEPGDTAEAVHQAMRDGKLVVIHVKVDPDAVLSFRRDALQKHG